MTCVFSSHDKFKELMNKELSLSDLNKENFQVLIQQSMLLESQINQCRDALERMYESKLQNNPIND